MIDMTYNISCKKDFNRIGYMTNYHTGDWKSRFLAFRWFNNISGITGIRNVQRNIKI